MRIVPYRLDENSSSYLKITWNKKVLLRERKRHTARRIASAHPAAVLAGGGGGEYPWPVLAGGGGTSVLSWLGGTQVLSWPGEYPSPVLAGGKGTPVLSWLGVSLSWGTPRARTGVPHLCRTGDTPFPHLGLGYSPSQDWDTPTWHWGTLPPPPVRTGYPPGRDLGKSLGLGYHAPERTWDQRSGKEPGTGVPPPPQCGQTDICENSTSPILRMRAVIIHFANTTYL